MNLVRYTLRCAQRVNNSDVTSWEITQFRVVLFFPHLVFLVAYISKYICAKNCDDRILSVVYIEKKNSFIRLEGILAYWLAGVTL